ncbi:nuclear transport factor 2 family protein [Rhodococcus spelaei]|uniref:Nuclear transport factor 2 family protein n=1 Tax=Rhodococcus spelaei TaxID=2546320 RepID=A0A541B9L5_9NOCA|nr:nuclear transport factor 2 family protein [Rhodococcus spelaei]TQF69022.1 nuclear transport factor 2 family protein [Rhodococcus spelaei]
MDLQHNVERLAATEAIRDLIYQYSHLIDRGELTVVAELFADATYGQCDANGIPIGGLIDRDPAAVLRANESFVQMHGNPPTPGTKHVITNVRVSVADNNIEASAHSYITVLQGTDELPLQPILIGRYFDTFGCIDGRWRFTQRLCRIDRTGDLTAHARRALS